MQCHASILRPRSRAGREKFWRDHLALQAQSAQSQAEYCRQNRLSRSSFSNWKKKLRASNSAPLTLVPVAVVTGHTFTSSDMKQRTKAGLSLVMANGCRIEIAIDFHSPTFERILLLAERL